MPVTQKDIARHLGISRSTVAQALLDIGRVHPETKEKILQTAHELGYRPNPMARALSSGKTDTVAFWFYPMLEPTYALVVNKLQVMVPPYNLIVMNLGLHKPSWNSHEEEFPAAEWPVDGVFAWDTGALPDAVFTEGTRTPLVYIAYSSPLEVPSDQVDTVLVELHHAAQAATRHLVATRDRVAMLCTASTITSHDGRARAYEEVLREAGRQPEYILTTAKRPYRFHAQQPLLDYVQEHGCPDAILCGNDEQATGVHLALRQLGLRVPEDVALVGCDDLEEAEYHSPPLSTIAHPFDEICAVAWEFLQKRIAEPETPRQFKVLKGEFVPRESSAPR